MLSWIYLGLGSAFFAASVAILGKIGVAKVDPTFATTLRSIIMALFLIFTSFFLGKLTQFNQLDKTAFLFIIFSGIAGALSWICYFWALRLGPATGTAALDRLSVVFVIVLSALFLGERLTGWSILGGILMTVGAVLLVLK